MQQLSANEIHNFQEILDAEKIRIQDRIKELSIQDPFSDPDRLTDNAATDTEASEESNHDRLTALLDELKAQLSATEDASTRIRNGSYGLCTNCSDAIDIARLSILPTAVFCMNCEQTKHA